MTLGANVRAFAERFGHDFADPSLILRALTHGSAGGRGHDHNQRLEFLGDRVLNLVIAEALFSADQGAAEGQLALRYNALVRKETCAEIAREIGLDQVLRIGRGEMRAGGRRKAALLADAMEAVIAAVYLDAGLEAAREAVLRHWASRLAQAPEEVRDAKTALQEWAQGRGEALPAYVEIARDGPDHAPEFTIEALLEDGRSARARARSKRAAEQAAAAALLRDVTE